MENNKKLYIIISILIAIIISLIITIILILNKDMINKKVDHTFDNNNQITDSTNNDNIDILNNENDSNNYNFFENEVDTKNSDDDIIWEEIKFIIDGFEFTCPSKYDITYFENVGPTVYLDDVFQMKIVVKDGSNSEIIKDKDQLTKKTIDAGGKILKEVSEANINGRTYTYFKMELGGEKYVVAFAPAPGDQKRFGGQIYMDNENLSDETFLEIFDDIVTSAVETKKPNSTLDDIFRRDVFIAPGEEKQSSTLTFKGKTISFNVPKGFYSTYVGDVDSFITESFSTEHISIVADVMFYPEDIGFNGIDSYLEAFIDEQKVASNGTSNPKIESKIINSNEVKYVLSSYEKEGSINKFFLGAIELDNKGMFVIKGSAFDSEDTDMNFSTFEQFFEIEK